MQINRRSLAALLVGAAVVAATAAPPRAAEPTPANLELRHMTWLDIKAAIAGGATTVLVPTGGIEQNGPHMVLGKHDIIVGTAALRIAREAGNTLVAPIVSFVPQGTIDPPTGNMQFPGTIGISDAVFEGLLDGIAHSLRHAGFKDIVLLGDHGLSQPVQMRVAQKLTKAWGATSVRVHHLDTYYDDSGQIAALKAEGETDATIGTHAGLLDTAELMSLNGASVDLARLALAKGNLASVGASGDPARASITLGARLLKMRTDAAIAQLKVLVRR